MHQAEDAYHGTSRWIEDRYHNFFSFRAGGSAVTSGNRLVVAQLAGRSRSRKACGCAVASRDRQACGSAVVSRSREACGSAVEAEVERLGSAVPSGGGKAWERSCT